jgi:hypothetical protein
MSDTIRRNELVPVSSRKSWPVGQRVARKTSKAEGTLLETSDPLKVQWDGAATTCYRHGGTDADLEARGTIDPAFSERT